jgi:replicative DNA helicase
MARDTGSVNDSVVKNDEIEQAILGSLLLRNEVLIDIREVLRPQDFFHRAHQRIYYAVQQLIGRGDVANPISLGSYLGKDESVQKIGGLRYLTQLVRSAPRSYHAVPGYARLLADLALRRELMRIGGDIISRAGTPSVDDPAASIAHQGLTSIHRELQTRGGTADSGSVVDALEGAATEIHERQLASDSIVGVPTGLRSVDRALTGLRRGRVYVLGGRPGMGKSDFACNCLTSASKLAMAVAAQAGDTPQHVGFLSMEMQRPEIGLRLLKAEASLTEAEMVGMDTEPTWRAAKDYIQTWPVKIWQNRRTMADSRMLLEQLMRDTGKPLQLVIIDHLQRVKLDGYGEYRHSLNDAVLQGKDIAQELDVPVLLLAQLSRKVEERLDKRPMLSDLRETGAIEENADVVMFLFRQFYYLSQAKPVPRERESDADFAFRLDDWQRRCDATRDQAEVIIEKNRHGATPTIDVSYDPTLSRFGNRIHD